MKTPSRTLPTRARIFGVVRQRQSYLNILYLFAAFPLGTIYFVFLITGLSVGISTLIIWVGVPLLVFMTIAWWWLGAFERELAMWWLGISITPMSRPTTDALWSWGRLRSHLSNALTWKSLLFLLVKLPIGTFTLVVGSVLLGVTSSLIVTPIVFVITLVDGGKLSIPIGLLSLAAGVLGLIVGLISLHVINGIAWLLGEFARFMLGMNATEMRVAEARAAAAQARARAEKAERSRRELIVNVSHELRTPIASIRGHVDSLLMATEGESMTPPQELHHYLAIVAREAERLGVLVDDLLALARADANELRLQIIPVNVAGIVEEVFLAMAPLAKQERQVTLVHEVAPGLPLVLADRQRLTQVLMNLVRNGITYTPDGGIVSIMLRSGGNGHLLLTVADTGIGIAAEDLDRVFERFYRADVSRTRASGGFGLGLAIVRDLVTAMGGTVNVSSALNEGSRFDVWLPISPTQPQLSA